MSATMYCKKIDYCFETVLDREYQTEVEAPPSTSVWAAEIEREVLDNFRYWWLGHMDGGEIYPRAPSAPVDLLMDLLS